MWFFKKKNLDPVPESKYKLKEFVGFRYRDDLKIGLVCEIKKNQDGVILYDIQIGGECPVIIEDIEESKIIKQ